MVCGRGRDLPLFAVLVAIEGLRRTGLRIVGYRASFRTQQNRGDDRHREYANRKPLNGRMEPLEPARDRRRPASRQGEHDSVEWRAFRRFMRGCLPLSEAGLILDDPGCVAAQCGGAGRVAEGAHRRKSLLRPFG